MMSVRRSVVIVAGLIAAVGCASRDVEVRTGDGQGARPVAAEVHAAETGSARFFAALDEVAFRGMMIDADPMDPSGIRLLLRMYGPDSVFVGRLLSVEDAGVGPYLLASFGEPTGKDEQRLRATFSTGAGERSVLLPAGTRNSLPSGWPVDLSSLVAEAPVGAEWLVVVQGKRDEEYSATLAALEPNGDTVSFGAVLRVGRQARWPWRRHDRRGCPLPSWVPGSTERRLGQGGEPAA
jgi:hypothetical protein